MSKHTIAKTKTVKETLALASLLRATECTPIGELVGDTGTGKSIAARAVSQELGGIRIVAFEGISRSQLLNALMQQLQLNFPAARHLDILGTWAKEQSTRPLLLVDEANKLNWRALEVLRYLADEGGWAIILIGTELYERQFASAHTRPLLLQLGRRIGAKRVKTGLLDRAETYTHILRPRLGDVADKDVITAFWQGSRKGNWGEGVELADACARVMSANDIGALTPAVLESALAWTANRREVA